MELFEEADEANDFLPMDVFRGPPAETVPGELRPPRAASSSAVYGCRSLTVLPAGDTGVVYRGTEKMGESFRVYVTLSTCPPASNDPATEWRTSLADGFRGPMSLAGGVSRTSGVIDRLDLAGLGAAMGLGDERCFTGGSGDLASSDEV